MRLSYAGVAHCLTIRGSESGARRAVDGELSADPSRSAGRIF